MNKKVLQSFSTTAKSIVVGSVYEHYKGFRYRILNIARHSETLEEIVVYQALYGDGDVWARLIDVFLENITINGQAQFRFKLVEWAFRAYQSLGKKEKKKEAFDTLLTVALHTAS